MAALLFKHALTLDSRHVVSSLRPGTSLHRFMSTLSDMDSTSNTDHSSPNPEQQKKKGRRKHRNNPSTPHHEVDPSKLGSLRNSSDPNLYRLFFRSPDKMRSLEDAQVFINHIKTNYGPLTQYQFSRCPETQKYFGYGFVTFKHEESLTKALKDAFIRVGRRDFELIRTGAMPAKRGINVRNTGFDSFYDLEELRAEKQKLEKANQVETEETAQEPVVEADTSVPFTSALPSSSASLSSSEESKSAEADSGSDTSSSSKPFFVPLEKKGHAQLWKSIPMNIAKAEKEAQKFSGDSENDDEEPKLPIP
ncbi:hypothetical protein CPB97_012177 [Podila verticillata]|nr:hypothetical protein CPB97_012177 [Podila verticillata]